MKKKSAVFCLLLMFIFGLSEARNEYQIDGNVRYRTIISSLRCLICQNQSIADSNTEFAHDIREKVIKLINLGFSNKKIFNFFIKRYGEYIYYRPVLDYRTFFLWAGPFIMLLIGLFILFKRVRNVT